MLNHDFSPIIISGPSGAGKNKLIDYLISKDIIFEEAPGVTTRERRVGEVGNTDFISVDEFLQYIHDDQLIQYAQFNGNYYGTLKTSLDLLKEKQVLFNMGLNGTKALKELRPDSSLFYILPPNKEELIRRMGNRGRQRYELGRDQTMQSIDLYDFLLISYTDNLELLYDDFMSVYTNEESGKEKSLKLERNKRFMRNFYN